MAVEAPKAEAPPVDMGADGFADLGVSMGGGGDGVAIPMAGGPVAAAAAAGPASAPRAKAVTKKAAESLAPSAADTCNEPPVRPKRKPDPLFLKYTHKAQEAEIEGVVRVRVTVDENGNVIAAQVLNGLGYGLDEVALDAAKKAHFEPATKCGRPVIGSIILPIRFQLGQ